MRSLKGSIFLILTLVLLHSCKTQRESKPYVSKPGNLSKYEKVLGISLPERINSNYIQAISSWVGAPYKYGGSTVNGTDCSGFVYSIYSTVFSIKLERSSSAMHAKAKRIAKSKLQEGDLLFFRIEGQKVNHVGMHITADYFIHASTKKGVVVSSMEEPYYKKHFMSYGTYL